MSYIAFSIWITFGDLTHFTMFQPSECPDCIRRCFRCCSSILLMHTLCCGIAGFICSMVFIVLLAVEDDTEAFWAVFIINFGLGLVQSWFLMDLLKMILQFYLEWTAAHPKPPGSDHWRDSCFCRTFYCLFKWLCCPLWCFWKCCCRTKGRGDPHDDGQNEFGVNYKEYLAWKRGEGIGNRKLPKKYQNLSMHAVAVNTKIAVNNAYQQQAAKAGRLKKKALAIVPNSSNQPTNADVELVVNDGPEKAAGS